MKEGNDGAAGRVDDFAAAADNLGNNSIAAIYGIMDDFADAQKNIANAAAANLPSTTAKLLGKLSGKNVKDLSNVKDALNSSKWAKGIGNTSVAFAGLSATLSGILAFKDQLGLSEGTVTALEALNGTMGAVLAGLQVAQEITKIVQSVQAFNGTVMAGLKNALSYTNTFSTAGLVLAVVVVAIIVVVALVMFFKMKDDNPVAAKTALAQGIATAVVVALLFVISLFFPIGTAIALLVGLLDGIFTAICKIANWVGGKDSDGKTFEDRNSTFCTGIVGNTVAAIAGAFYRTKPMVDLFYKGRIQLGQTGTKLIEQNGLVGFSADNKLEVKQAVTITVSIPDAHTLNPKDSIGIDGSTRAKMKLSDYDELIKSKTIFSYGLVTDPDSVSNESEFYGKTPTKWQSIGNDSSRQRLYKVEEATIQITLTPGINFTPTLHLREFYEFPVAACGLFAGGCDYKIEHFNNVENNRNKDKDGNDKPEDKRKKQEINDLGKNLIYDVFPSTLTEFYTLEQVQEKGQFVNRYRLAWGGKTLPFPTLLDADGDGLRSDGTSSMDPDDKTGDKDNDGLPDAFEMQDYRLNPSSAGFRQRRAQRLSGNSLCNSPRPCRFGWRWS